MTAVLPPYLDGRALMEWVRQFDALGTHRTGSAGDEATTEWLIARLAEAGIHGEAHSFTFPKLDVTTAELHAGGEVIAGHAQMDAGLTRAGGVDGPLVSVDAVTPGAIAVLDARLEGAAHAADAAVSACAAAGAGGLIVIGRRPTGSITLMNAPHLSWPAPLPVLFIPQAEAGTVAAALAAGGSARLVVEGERVHARATNVIARVPADAGLTGAAPIGLMTPKSGWFHCAAERGGGIVIWLAVAAALANTPGRTRDVVLAATSGHELGHAGLEAWLLEFPAAATVCEFWVHLGASIGAAVAPNLGMFASDSALQRQMEAQLTAAGAGPYRTLPAGVPPGGEARNVALRGGRFVSFAGGHAYFHTPEDRPDKVDAAAVARYATAVTSFVVDAART